MKRVWAILAIVSTFWVSVAWPGPLRVLPDIKLSTSSGQPLTGEQLPIAGKWLLVYLSGDEKADRNLLSMMQGLRELTGGERVTLVVAGAVTGQLETMMKRNDKLQTFRWTADTDRSAARALQLGGSATVIGMNGSSMEWIVGGTGKDKKVLTGIMENWVR